MSGEIGVDLGDASDRVEFELDGREIKGLKCLTVVAMLPDVHPPYYAGSARVVSRERLYVSSLKTSERADVF